MAQLVARLIWDQEAADSSSVTPTKYFSIRNGVICTSYETTEMKIFFDVQIQLILKEQLIGVTSFQIMYSYLSLWMMRYVMPNQCKIRGF